MVFAMGLKDAYFGLEDKWYAALDKISTKIPIYRIIDPIDRVVPSFILLIATIVTLVAIFAVLPLLSLQQATVTVVVEDELGNILQGVKVDYTIEGTIDSRITDADGQIRFGAPFNSTIELHVSETTVDGVEYETKQISFLVEEEKEVRQKLVLQRKGVRGRADL